jgi:hypothetical protein
MDVGENGEFYGMHTSNYAPHPPSSTGRTAAIQSKPESKGLAFHSSERAKFG